MAGGNVGVDLAPIFYLAAPARLNQCDPATLTPPEKQPEPNTKPWVLEPVVLMPHGTLKLVEPEGGEISLTKAVRYAARGLR